MKQMKYIQLILVLHWMVLGLCAQPAPGDVFRDYIWTMPNEKTHEPFLRVGGPFDYHKQTEKFPESHYFDGKIAFTGTIELTNAIKAELVIEKMQCHDETKNLKIQFNSGGFIPVPESNGIPEPQSDYLHHINAIMELPLEHIKPSGNRFEMVLGEQHGDHWPQHLIYGLVLRIYYDKNPSGLNGSILVNTNNKITLNTEVKFKPEVPENVEKVHFIGHYNGINYEGDGSYNRWHHHYHQGEISYHVGTTSGPAFEIHWNTEWLPDQEEPLKLAAWIQGADGLIYFHPGIGNLKLNRDYSVKLYQPYDQPKNWVTRTGEHSEKIRIKENLDHAVAAKLIWRSWSPGYMNGLYVNDFLIFTRKGPEYRYKTMCVESRDMQFFHTGENIITTGMTPRYHGEMVHGMEVQWPGIMVLIKYMNKKDKNN